MKSFIEIPKPLILASRSPRRAELLRQIGLEFEIRESAASETIAENTDPINHVLELSQRKAADVASQTTEGLIIGADTIVVLDTKILGKPRDRIEAQQMLQLLSGHEHHVYTGFTLFAQPEEKYISDFEKTAVRFRKLEDWEIEHYIDLDQPFDKAGSYGIQDHSAIFVESISGCYYNVVGFPLTKFYVVLQKFLSELGYQT